MDWVEYESKFSELARRKGYTHEDILTHLAYSRKLFDQKLPIIFDQEHLSLLVGFEVAYLRRISNAPRFFYRRFEIPKKNNMKRVIFEPLLNLKEIQKWILKEILDKCKPSRYAKAFVYQRSIKDNAYFHKDQEGVLKLDIVDFFGSIRDRKIFDLFFNLGYSPAVSRMLTNICCLRSRLPQGAPTSPALSNLVSKRLDKRIFGFSKKMRIRYTRYADDMTFSGSLHPGTVIEFIKKVLSAEGLRLNSKKTKFMEKHQRQEVTGVVTNQKLQISRSKRRELRKNMFYINKYGLSSHLQRINCQKPNYLRHLLGKVEFAKFIDPENKEMSSYSKQLKKYLEDEG